MTAPSSRFFDLPPLGRCIRFLLDLLPSRAVPDVLTAVRLNVQVQHGLDLDESRIALWIGVGVVGHP
eukprot:7389785-Prymnesium_polylepis.2